jgi:glutaredoxin
MNATKKLAAASLLFIAASIFTVGELAKERKTHVPVNGGQDTALVLYYGDGCPHCKLVENYVAQNNLQAKLSLSEKEVWKNQANQNELIEKATICKLDLNSLGVPILWDAKESKCYEGDQPIIDFLKTQTGQIK